jgi:hypothetical protein
MDAKKMKAEVENLSLELDNLVTNVDTKGDEDAGQRGGSSEVGLEAREVGGLSRTALIRQASLDWLLSGDNNKSKTELSMKDISLRVRQAESWGIGGIWRDRWTCAAMRSSV